MAGPATNTHTEFPAEDAVAAIALAVAHRGVAVATRSDIIISVPPRFQLLPQQERLC